jgi:hypothetical protein
MSSRGPAHDASRLEGLCNSAIPAFDRIQHEWATGASRKWQTFRKSSLPVGDAEVMSLNPAEPVSVRSWATGNLNQISSAMRVTWHSVTLLLGADCPRETWHEIARDFHGLGDHHAMKVPHHGSAKAFHDSFGKGRRDRWWIITPFMKKLLPLKKRGGGLENALGYVDKVFLTSLPFSHDLEHEAPCETTRKELEDDLRPIRTRMVSIARSVREARFIALSFRRTGEIVDRWFGRGTVTVSEGRP